MTKVVVPFPTVVDIRKEIKVINLNADFKKQAQSSQETDATDSSYHVL